MRITVTEEDIARGVRCRCLLCPVALAVARATGRDCLVLDREILFPGVGRVRLPLAVARRLRRYDDGWAMRPFSFEVTVP